MTDIKEKRVLTKKHTELHFFDEVYRVYLVFMVTPRADFKTFLAEHGLKKDIMDDLNLETASGYCLKLDDETTDSENDCFVIWLQKKHLPCLTHELSHLTMMTFEEKGVPTRVENQEAFAYYIEHWVKRITEIWKFPRGRKNG